MDTMIEEVGSCWKWQKSGEDCKPSESDQSFNDSNKLQILLQIKLASIWLLTKIQQSTGTIIWHQNISCPFFSLLISCNLS